MNCSNRNKSDEPAKCTCAYSHVFKYWVPATFMLFDCYYSPGTFRAQRHPRTCWSWWTREWRPCDSLHSFLSFRFCTPEGPDANSVAPPRSRMPPHATLTKQKGSRRVDVSPRDEKCVPSEMLGEDSAVLSVTAVKSPDQIIRNT